MTITVALKAVRSGMALGTDVQDANGSLLLPAGCVLTVAALASLKRRGVTWLAIAIDAATAPVIPKTPPASRAQVTARVDFLFRNHRSAANIALRDALLAYRLQDLT